MILKASQRGFAKELAAHLMNTKENEHVEVHEIRGFSGTTIKEAFEEAYAISRGTRCKQHLFSLSLNPPEDKDVTTDMFEVAINKVERKLGLSELPRAIVFHEKYGRRHAHCIWSRIDPETMKAVNLPHYKLKLRDLSRELYLEHGWDMPQGLRQKQDKHRDNFELSDWQQCKRHGDDVQAKKQLFQKCWLITQSGQGFVSAMAKEGYTIAKGDKRNFVAIDWRGEVYSLSRWTGAKNSELTERLGHNEQYLSVSETKAIIDTYKLSLSEKKITNPYTADSLSNSLLNARKEMIERHKAERKAFDRNVQQQSPRLKDIFQKSANPSQPSAQQAERHKMVLSQLRERRTLQRQIKAVQVRPIQLTKLHKRDLSAYMKEDLVRDLLLRQAVIAGNEVKHTNPAAEPMLAGSDVAPRTRAGMVFREEYLKWQAQIESIARNPHLSKYERDSSIAALREQQENLAMSARDRAAEEDYQLKRAEERMAEELSR